MQMGKKWKRVLRIAVGILASAYLFPVVFTCLQSFVSPEEISALYSSMDSGVYKSLRCALLPRQFSFRQYYEVLLNSSAYLMSFWNSAALSILITALNTMLSVALGYMLATARFFGRKAAVRFVAVTMLLPWQAMMLPNYLLSKWLGIYDSWAALIIVQGFSSFGVFLMYQFMRSVPEELINAASLDTNSSFVILLRIACPIAKPGIIACMALAFAESWNMVEQPLTLIEDTLKYPLSMLINTMSIEHVDIAFACAVVYMFPVIALSVFFGQKLMDGVAILHTGGTQDG